MLEPSSVLPSPTASPWATAGIQQQDQAFGQVPTIVKKEKIESRGNDLVPPLYKQEKSIFSGETDWT
jgi:hypothetical protein